MAWFDLPLEKLRTYTLDCQEPADFDAFWAQTLAQARAHPVGLKLQPVEHAAYRLVDVQDVTFNGFAGQPVKGWLIRPKGLGDKLPCLVHFIGYSGGRSFAVDYLIPAVAGLAVLVMDSRGQGWTGPGHTPDVAERYDPHVPGVMTRGINSPQDYYYRRIYTDAARAVEAAAACPGIDPQRIGVAGGSQGGGLAIAAAGLSGSAVKIALADVPFLCGFRRAATLVDTLPYQEIANYLKCHRDRVETAFRTLAYFDGVNLAKRITARSFFSVALMDNICPPSTVFAAYNNIPAPKDIRVYEFNNHEGGGPFHTMEKMAFAARHL